MSAEDPSNAEIEFDLALTELDTARSRIRPTPKQYEALARKLDKWELTERGTHGATFASLATDVSRLMNYLPPSDAVHKLEILYSALRASKFVSTQGWRSFFDEAIRFIQDNIQTTSNVSQKAFWNSCYDYLFKLSVLYKDLM